jgi:hypothetical protein
MKIVVLDDYEKSMIFLQQNPIIQSKASIEIYHERLSGPKI